MNENIERFLRQCQRLQRAPDEDFQLHCAVCNQPLLDCDHYGHLVEIRRAKFQFDETGEIDEVNEKAKLHICENCYLTDPDLCRFFNKIGWRIR